MKIIVNKWFRLSIIVTVGLVLICLVKYNFINKVSKTRLQAKVTLRLLWTAQTQFAGYYVANDLGYYEDEGLDVEIVPSLGAGDIIAVIGSNYFQFGVTQLSNLIRAVDRNMPVKSIAQIVQESNLVLLTRKKDNINSIQDFRDKILSSWWGREEFMSKILLQMNGMSQNDIKILDEKYWTSKSFADGRADIVTAMMYNELNQYVYKENISQDSLRIFAYKDYNLNFPEDTLFTSAKMIEYYPDICSKVLKATLKGWKAALTNKKMAVDTVLKYASDTTYDEQMRQLNVIADTIVLKNMDVNDVGHINRDKIQNEIDMLHRYKIINHQFSVDDLFDNRFVNRFENEKDQR